MRGFWHGNALVSFGIGALYFIFSSDIEKAQYFMLQAIASIVVAEAGKK